MRGLLVVNPQATTTSPRTSDIILAALSAQLDLEVVPTQHRDHARALGEQARRESLDVVVTFGGDGTVNEVVNGLMAHQPVDTAADEASIGPILAPIPGGSANVFARALGLPRQPVEAAGEILASLEARSIRMISLGHASITSADSATTQRWFTANAGLGIDAGVIDAMEEQRAAGLSATPSRYLRTAVRQYFTGTDRTQPALSMHTANSADDPDVTEGVFWAIVQNTSPWTYLGGRPIDACPDASFDTGLDVFALRRMGLMTAVRASRRLLANSRAGSTKRSITVWHDIDEVTIDAHPPRSMQVDGEGLGLITRVVLRSHPSALATIRPLPDPSPPLTP